MSNLLFIILIGVGATAAMDIWNLIRKPLFGIPFSNYGMMGRWMGHMAHGQFRHDAIAAAPSIAGEQVIGWTAHYVIGVIFAALLVGLYGNGWVGNPTIGPALAVGVATVAAPFLLMQPGMGAGIAASRTPNPASARLHSLVNHIVYGLGLYLSGCAVQMVSAV
ncbi:DUF2938 domain-containing protein [Endozoicomonas sp. OPT23]|uniref:DUF2938 domain-containing protein n=1 Tax=Endozoicomonas sp. OPT23 TaxID=2072845 RepID=UPI00129ACF25|nr:DUF2938 domain-containing protein [Endozoicomonas sp. OPT23]MRI34898.1 DUF2938 domain-containing protein [Endozoicomonas sp. OPT23]